jgi:CHAT domain-containing protein
MAATHQRVLRGEPIEKAIAMPERELRSHPGTAHPYYWAAFAVFGV